MATLKRTIKATADQVNSNKMQSTVRLVVEDKPIIEPGKPPARTAKTVIQIMYSDPKSAMEFESGKEYTVTIEGK